MNPIRSLILITSILLSGLTFTGCSHSAEASPPSDQTAVMSSDTLKSNEGKAIMDSISKLYVKNAAFNDTIKSQKSVISALETRTSDLEKWIYIALATAGLALILVGWAIYCVMRTNERITRRRKDIEDLNRRVDILIQKIDSQRHTPVAQSSKDYNALASRLYSLEKTINQSQVAQDSTQVAQQPAKAKAVTEEKGFFGIPTQMSETDGYFKKKINSESDSEVRFKATITDKTRASFEPMIGDRYLATLKSSDTMKFAVETTGCPLAEAKSMTFLTSGEAQLKNSRWEITQKALILLQ